MDIEKVRLFAKMQQSEAKLHWRRNSYFLLVSSILLVALSQFKIEFLPFFIGILGLVLNIVWFFIQYRSSQYIKYWKTQAQKLATPSMPNIYPELGGVEIRKLAYILPATFIMIWIVVIILAVTGKFLIKST